MNTLYQFGAVSFTILAIKETAYRHGADGICFYPPSCWYTEDGSRGHLTPVDETYRLEYERGKADRAAGRYAPPCCAEYKEQS